MNNLILTCCAQYSWKQIEPFFVSLQRHIPTCRCICLVWNVSEDTRSFMLSHNVELVDMQISTRMRGLMNRWRALTNYNPARFLPKFASKLIARHAAPVASLRFFYYLDYLNKYSRENEKVFLIDIRDVVFQADPFHYVSLNGVQFYMEDPVTNRIGWSGDVNRIWLDTIYGNKLTANLDGKPVSCSGTISGSTRDITLFLKAFVTETQKLRFLPYGGTDQAVHNKLLYNTKVDFKRDAVPNAEGAVLTVLNTPKSEYSLGADDLVRNKAGVVIPVLHTYDRFPELVAAQRRRLGLGNDILKTTSF